MRSTEERNALFGAHALIAWGAVAFAFVLFSTAFLVMFTSTL